MSTSANDQDYYRNRALQQRSIAELAVDGFVRTVHLDLAQRYQALADGVMSDTTDGYSIVDEDAVVASTAG